jgi:uncharacterized RDD family membrane protein YckC
LGASPNDSTGQWRIGHTTGNLAAAPAPARRPADATAVSPQRTLFPDRAASNIIPFDRSGAVLRPSIAGVEQRVTVKPQPKPVVRRPAARPPKPDMQPQLDFLPLAPPAPRKLKTTVEASIYCDAPVATLTHRSVAAALDFSIILIGYALFLAAFYFMLSWAAVPAGGAAIPFPLNRLTLTVLAGGFVIISAFYGALWTLGRSETPGMRWTNLRLTNFDGFPPETGPRILRYFATCLSFATCGLGLLWALVDEENLTWQDHISKTFPTFYQPETNFRRA